MAGFKITYHVYLALTCRPKDSNIWASSRLKVRMPSVNDESGGPVTAEMLL